MYQFDAERIHNQKSPIHLYFICVILLLGTGLVTFYSASYAFILRNGNNLVVKQVIFAGVGILIFIVCTFISIDLLRKLIKFGIIITIVLCSLILIPNIRVEHSGAARWIQIGPLTYQPSEMIKFIIPLYLAHVIDKKSENISKFKLGILTPLLMIIIFLILIFFQNNLSTAVFIFLNAVIILFIGGVPLRYFFTAIAVVSPVIAFIIFSREHRVTRLVSFLSPNWDPGGATYQISGSKDAIISGGFWGKGIGEGTRKIASIPEIHSDFIFSSYVEETGFLGVLLFFALFAAFAFLGYRTALKSSTMFGRLLAAGLTTMIISQALLNVAVVSGALPATGIPLPFFSAGGSSLLTTLICAGVIANVARTESAVVSSDSSNIIFKTSEDSDE